MVKGLIMKKDNDIIQKIKDDIRKSGFPLEIEVSSILQDDGWIVHNQVYYRDKDTGKDRAVDIAAFKRFDGDFTDYDFFHVSLIIECKRSSCPWVFYTVPKGRTFEVPFGLIKHRANPRKTIKYIRFTYWMRHSHYYLENLREQAIIPYVPFKEGRKGEIFEASSQVIKALDFQLITLPKIPNIHQLSILYPIVVFDGQLFRCRVENKCIEALPTNYLQYLVRRSSLTEPLRGDLFLVDVIKKDFLKEYLEILKNEFDAITLELQKP